MAEHDSAARIRMGAHEAPATAPSEPPPPLPEHQLAPSPTGALGARRVGTAQNTSYGRADWYGSYLYFRGTSIWASAEGQRIASYTADRTAIAADSLGNRILKRGTVMSSYNGGPRLGPRTTGTAVGIYVGSAVNLMDSDVDIGVAVGGVVNETRLWDNGTYGSVAAGVKTDLPFIQFVKHDL